MAKTEIFYEGDLRTRCRHVESSEEISTDAPKDNQGQGRFFSPTDLVGVALGSCVLTIMGIYAGRNHLDLTGAKIEVDKEMATQPPRRIKKLTLKFTCPQRFNEEVQKRLEKIAHECPVHLSLHPDIVQEFTFTWGVS